MELLNMTNKTQMTFIRRLNRGNVYLSQFSNWLIY